MILLLVISSSLGFFEGFTRMSYCNVEWLLLGAKEMGNALLTGASDSHQLGCSKPQKNHAVV